MSPPEPVSLASTDGGLTDLSTLSTGKDKLVQKAIDFEKLEESGIKDGKWDVVFITDDQKGLLGARKDSRRSTESPFISHDLKIWKFILPSLSYVVNSAKEARVADLPQRIVYLSAGSANSKSSFLYSRSKGQTEEALANLGYSDTIVFPETIAEGIFSTLRLSSLFSNLEIKARKSIATAGWLGSEKLPPVARAAEEKTPEGNRFVSIPNAGAAALAQTPLE
ncbi:hypothetical protein IW261DRAFT_1557818 [Armillaria novae-zelandiae]|uniref:Uncharacterized protein n=1 Tax=Armillaria novae-zelandiae TaxID=153914 RepID=A0AA39PUC0_9AGAR|nr:hypothetical protein IW261DRAFT_1557818 [Armillaria novae-zelandiae]